MPDFDFFHLSVKSSDGVEDFLLRSKSRYGTNMLNGVSGMEGVVKGTAPFTPTSEMFFCFSQFTSDEAVYSLVLLSTRSLSLLLEIFRLV
ncbi:hypothetical protein BASA83_009474 [Batrachochytrium salamandrivorans]|nr:hypothetical protein BASA83_009474 [Batrachochytrium salamandrivorans]